MRTNSVSQNLLNKVLIKLESKLQTDVISWNRGQLRKDKSRRMRLNQQIHMSEMADCAQNLVPLLPGHIAMSHFLVVLMFTTAV